MIRAFRNYWLVSFVLVALVPDSRALAQEPDYIGIAVMYGEARHNILQTEIMNDAGRRLGRSAGNRATASPTSAWPAHIGAADVDGHVFTIAELAAMQGSDPARMRAMLEGRLVTVQGPAAAPGRSEKGVRLADPDSGYGVWAYFGTSAQPPAQGEQVRLRGIADLRRRGYLTLGQPELLRSAPVPAARSGHQASAAVAVDVVVPDYRALAFASTKATTTRVASALADSLAPSLAAGRSRQELEQLIAGGELQRDFARVLGDIGFSPNDFADVFTGVLVLSWQVANGIEETDAAQKRGVVVIRDRLREALARMPWLPGLSDDDKQMLAESMVVGAMLIAARYQQGARSGDAGLLSAARADAQAMIQQSVGLDLQRMMLGATGFQVR